MNEIFETTICAFYVKLSIEMTIVRGLPIMTLSATRPYAGFPGYIFKVEEAEQLHAALGVVRSEEVKPRSESILQVQAIQVRLQVRYETRVHFPFLILILSGRR